MLWLKAFHLIFVVSWFAGLFYLPRLFVYHAQAQDTAGIERFRIMERKLFAMMTLTALLAVALGLTMIVRVPALLAADWLRVKLGFVALLLGYHGACFVIVRDFRRGTNRRSHRWYRVFNEVPLVLLIVIVLLAVLKPQFG